MSNLLRSLLGIAHGLTLLTCVACTPTFLQSSERELGVGDAFGQGDLRVFHSALLYPDGLGLFSPGFIVGIENVRSSAFVDRHRITHIIRYSQTDAHPGRAIGSCVLVAPGYDQEKAEGARKRPDDPGYRLFEMCQTLRSSQSLSPLDLMKKAVIDEANSSAFTHIVLVVMGWNNDQQKALVSINSMIGQMTAEAAESDRPFHPLIIGVTWPSMWLTGEWLPVPSQAVVLASLLNKANDADMIGRDLVRPMICKSLIARAKANKLIPLVMIGHSFGARILVEALRQTDEGPCLDSEQKVFAFKPDDRLILLEGAFDISRLYGPHGWALDVQKLRVTLTASEHDQATSSAFWGSYAGNILTFERVCRQQPSMCGQAQVEGRYGFDICKQSRDNHTTQSAPDVRSPVRYFDASSLINCRAPLHHGGAHDDIFRRETARFLLDEIG